MSETQQPTELENVETVQALKPSYAPPGIAMGVMFLVWGTQTQYLMSVGGALLILGSLWMWMREIAEQWGAEA